MEKWDSEKIWHTDIVLKHMADAPNMQFPIETLKNDLFRFHIDCDVEIGNLLRYHLVESISGSGYYYLFRITNLGLTVAKTSTFLVYSNQIKKAQILKEEKEKLELIKLRREVHLQPWQFWILVIGFLLGIITFVKDWLFK